VRFRTAWGALGCGRVKLLCSSLVLLCACVSSPGAGGPSTSAEVNPDEAVERLILATEYLPYSEVEGWRAFLADHVLALAPAYTQGEHSFPELAGLVRHLGRQGVPVMLWPLLAEKDGRYLNVHTWPAFNAFTRELLGQVRDEGLPVSWVLLNLEMDSRIEEYLKEAFRTGGLRGVIEYLVASADLDLYEEAVRQIRALVADAHRLGFKVAASTLMVVLDDYADGDRTLQLLFTTPIQDIEWDAVAYQVYRGGFNADLGQLFPGLQFGHDFVYDYARTILQHHPETGGVSLGSIPLVDDPPDGYATVEDLHGDFAAAAAAGFTRNKISIWSLDGISRMADPAAWVDYDCCEPHVPEPDRLTRAFRELVAEFDQAIGEESAGLSVR
jgi:hypothetical protein